MHVEMHERLRGVVIFRTLTALEVRDECCCPRKPHPRLIKRDMPPHDAA